MGDEGVDRRDDDDRPIRTARIDDEDDDDRPIKTAGINDEDAGDVERGGEHGDGGAFLIWGGTDIDACAVTLSPDASRWYIIDVSWRQHFDVGGYEANRSNCGQTNCH